MTNLVAERWVESERVLWFAFVVICLVVVTRGP